MLKEEKKSRSILLHWKKSGKQMQEAIEALEMACDSIDEVMDGLGDCLNQNSDSMFPQNTATIIVFNSKERQFAVEYAN